MAGAPAKWRLRGARAFEEFFFKKNFKFKIKNAGRARGAPP